ncbi:penicillin-binding protein [Halarcobacter anaerophilus]|uniref:Penicillin-binding protein n=2 Tax=Halarcobacter anaerophilus TaxID=877500 RepID=A0A4Q0XYZ6_9BACT|nr:PBP1A family penicillin-binding protein [Halarcobacter anaerophilus]QDF29955.1 penicillin-binding protein 1A [Halarcobacter anaerophilus]RXJ62917.1 penicillin-binding protein [Halarcobacter anaerophilus]
MMKYIFTFLLIIGIGIAGWLLNLYNEIRGDLDKVVNYNPPKTTQFFDRDGKLIANIFKKEHRLYVKYEDIPARVVEALVAIEDTHFFEHHGINPDAISRAMIKNIKAMKYVEGASTLTQQLIKSIVLTREKKLIRKIKEALLAVRLETILTKEQILERYLNQVYFGHSYYGIRTAAQGYFRKDLFELNLKEIAILVGLPKAPSFYDPTRNLKFTLTRANQVISRMHTLGWINDEEYKDSINYIPKVYNDTLTKNKAPYIVDYAIKILHKDIKDIRSGGYKINLTIDLDAQKIAREALKYGYDRIIQRDEKLQKNPKNNVDHDGNEVEEGYFVNSLNGALISIENNTGKILAMVGGVDYKESSFNRVVQSRRQPGSSAKPFFYQTALDLGYSPASQLIDIGRTYNYEIDGEEKKWQPKNYGGKFKGIITLRESLVKSRNLATINLVTDVGIDEMYKGLENFGITGMPKDLSITLGSFSISPFDFSKAYSSFSNDGIQVTPYMINSITNSKGETINFEPEVKYVDSPEQIYLMKSILEDVVLKGTGRRAKVKGIELAGKTGTTNNNTDAWFCGFSPTIQTIVWFGKDDNTAMRRSEGGGTTAAPSFSYFYKKYLEIHPEIQREFQMPDNVKSSYVNGHKEYYTQTSPLPKTQMPVTNEAPNGEIIEF